MPVVTGSGVGEYNLTINHVSNGDPANQTVFRAPSINLENRTDALKTFVELQETLRNAQLGSSNSSIGGIQGTFNTSHQHTGGAGGALIDFSQVYQNDNDAAVFSLHVTGSFTIKSTTNTVLLHLSNDTDRAFIGKQDVINIGDDGYILRNPLTKKLQYRQETGGYTRDVDHGVPPIGSIVAYSGGYFGNGSNGSFTSAIGNSVAAINTYVNPIWQVCDGSALNDSQSPIYNGAGRYLPNLTDSRFLQGSSSAGAIGGENNTTLAVSNLPTHNHTINHTHSSSNISGSLTAFSGTLSLSGNTGEDTPDHAHIEQGTAAGGASGGMVASGALAPPANPTTFYTAGASVRHHHPISGNYAFSLASGSSSISGTADGQSFSGFSGDTGSASSFSNRPSYLSVIYIQRVR